MQKYYVDVPTYPSYKGAGAFSEQGANLRVEML